MAARPSAVGWAAAVLAGIPLAGGARAASTRADRPEPVVWPATSWLVAWISRLPLAGPSTSRRRPLSVRGAAAPRSNPVCRVPAVLVEPYRRDRHGPHAQRREGPPAPGWPGHVAPLARRPRDAADRASPSPGTSRCARMDALHRPAALARPVVVGWPRHIGFAILFTHCRSCWSCATPSPGPARSGLPRCAPYRHPGTPSAAAHGARPAATDSGRSTSGGPAG